MLEFFQRQPPCLIGMEACASAHYWARELTRLGHDARLMPPSYVKGYVKRAKTDRSVRAVGVRRAKIGCGRSSEPQETETGGNRARQPHGAHGPCSFEEWNGIPGGNTRLNKIGAFSSTEKASAS